MAIKRKKSKSKKRIRSSTKLMILSICGILALISLVGIYSNVFTQKYEERKEEKYKYSDKYKQEYIVELKENRYMESESLGENQLYVTDLIENLKLKINYTYEGTDPEKINCTYKITGKLKATYSSDGKEEEIWNKEYVILESKEKNTTEELLNVNEIIDIDLKQYNELVDDFIEKMQMAITTKLYIQFEANVTAYSDGEMILDKYNNQLEVSLGDKVTKIEGKKEEFKEEAVTKTTMVLKENNKELTIFYVITLMISLYIILKVQKETKTSNKITNIYKMQLNQILGSCGERIVKIDSKIKTYGITLIELKDINELIKLSEELYKPILYYQVPGEKEAWFCLTLENETYRYILK